jgi:Universal stress protein family
MRPVSRRSLLATDGSEEAELAARVAVKLAKSTGSELHLVHVKLLPITSPYPDVLDWRWREDLERAEREARELLDEQAKKVEAAARTVAGAHLRGTTGRGDRRARRGTGRIPDRRGEAGLGTDKEGVGRERLRLVVRHARCPVRPRGRAGACVADNRARLSRGT